MPSLETVMRAVMLTLLLLSPLAVAAQPAPPPPGTLPPGAPPGMPMRGAITRDQFIQRAMQAAGQRFDAIDVNHTGVITRDQLRAWRQAHLGQGQGGALRGGFDQ